ncbi:hypothetical protein PanWU01x14_317220 [Parasponia andersonii]|uniref:Uncharacterized protein n=1 Tax=Parasponia andersonii TaxID=3476 RepID=A0A2P5AN11_PARAD|nr:hypothetical protein PanWU01x14_317220 [Parasponia andersonii]
MANESIEDKSLGEILTNIHEASFVHSFNVEAKKALHDANLLGVPPYLARSKPLVKLLNASLSFHSHHKPYKEKTKKWCVKKKKNFKPHFEPDSKVKLGNSCLNLFLSKLKGKRMRHSTVSLLSP